MWRITLFIILFCSIGLNVYFFLQLNARAIENSLLRNNSQISTIKPTLSPKVTQETDKGLVAKGHLLSQKIKMAINARDYFLASFLINALANEDKRLLPEIKIFWLQDTHVLINQKLFSHAENSISGYLEFQSDDIDFLSLQVDLYLQQKLTLLAIKYAYEIQYHVFTEVKKEEMVDYARQLVSKKVEILIQNSLWLELRELVEQVIIFDPQNLHLQWLFAQALYQLAEFEDARIAIEPLLNQPNYKVKSQTLLKKIETALRKPESIPLNRQGEHFIVQGNINDSFNVSLMIDTGASISLLSEQTFEQLNQYSEVEYVKDLKLNTAGGQVTASIYKVAEFSLQGYAVNDFVFAVSPYISEENDGLLGMNYLGAFDFHIDQTDNLLLLENK